MPCDHCDETFGSDRERIQHTLDAHSDELTSHDRDELKRELNKLDAQDDTPDRSRLKLAGFAVAALAVLAVGGYGLSMTGMVSFTASGGPGGNTDATLGPAGSTHEHAIFSVVVNGESIDFSQRRYQLQSDYIHFEGGGGTQIHKHATGTTIAYALDTLGMGINQSCLETLDGTYCESDGDLSVTAGGSPVDPEEYVIQDGVPVRVEYAK